MSNLALLEQLHLPHWLIAVGGALVLFGAIGSIVRGFRDVTPDEVPLEVASDREDPPSFQQSRGTPERPEQSRPSPQDEDMLELLNLTAGGVRGRTKGR
jgi:hypothetical protein